MRWIRGVVMTAAVLMPVLMPNAAAGQSTIELRAAARVDPAAAVTLERVAVLNGPEAMALAGTVVLGAGATMTTLGVEQLREALEQADRNVNWGRVVLRGSSCRLVRAEPTKAAAAKVERAVPLAAGAETVRAGVEERLRAMAGVEAEDFRVTFAPGDADFLAVTTRGRTLELRVGSVSERLPVAVAVYEKDRVVAERTIRVLAQVRRESAMAAGAIRRGEAIENGHVAEEPRWMAWGATSARRDEVVGRTAKRAIAAGEAIEADAMIQPLAAKRGEVIQVRSVSGTVVVTTKARALGPARVGEMAECQGLGGGTTFMARMDAPGRGVVAGVKP
ncbi:MAG: flagellar basal body P-ring formation chaperone FlgA [Phycisphaerales bacterium]